MRRHHIYPPSIILVPNHVRSFVFLNCFRFQTISWLVSIDFPFQNREGVLEYFTFALYDYFVAVSSWFDSYLLSNHSPQKKPLTFPTLKKLKILHSNPRFSQLKNNIQPLEPFQIHHFAVLNQPQPIPNQNPNFSHKYLCNSSPNFELNLVNPNSEILQILLNPKS